LTDLTDLQFFTSSGKAIAKTLGISE